MREVEVTRFVPAPPAAVARSLTPARVVECEGSFRVADVTEADGETRVTVAARGLEFDLRFHEREDGYEYVQEGGPLDALETTLTYRAEDEGTRVTMRSRVSFGLPPAALTDRVAAWKRRGELRRALDALVAEHE